MMDLQEVGKESYLGHPVVLDNLIEKLPTSIIRNKFDTWTVKKKAEGLGKGEIFFQFMKECDVEKQAALRYKSEKPDKTDVKSVKCLNCNKTGDKKW